MALGVPRQLGWLSKMPESIDPTSDRPVYRQIADQLREAIREGRYGEGDASYVPWSLAEGTQMVERDSGPGGICSRLADVGHGPVGFTEEVATRMPTPEEARLLRLTDPQPVFNLFRTAFDASGAPVEVCEHVMSGGGSTIRGTPLCAR